ncbi:MAG TPA: DinB family protein [Candidatus Dormibacteraeota bacterium]|nr:DinB family protein [Candidatus Dormibacteraeota bacterium]
MEDVLDAARRVVSTTAARWQSLVERMPPELLERPPAPGEWSAADCLRHLLRVERQVLPVRVRLVLEGRDLASFDPGAADEPAPERTPREVLDAFVALRRENEALLAGIAAADLDRSSRHPEYGSVSLRTLLNVWAAHDLQHTVQAEEALMQPFIPDTGPFRFRFADHDRAAVLG